MTQKTDPKEQKSPVKRKPENPKQEAAAMTVCPECGKETVKTVGNVCPECFGKRLNLFELPQVLHARVCPRCGAHYYKSKWEDLGTPEEVAVLTAEVIKKGFEEAAFDMKTETDHRTLLLPGLAARLQNDIEKMMGISTMVGPMDSGRLAKWLEENRPPKK